jgi:histidinol-phosphate/aromatic aminotransferase/cobyric acid decarboxylase-like protein
MRINRRQLLREFGTAAASSALFPNLAESAFDRTDSSAGSVRLNRNESAYGPCGKAKVAFHAVFTEANRYPGEDVGTLRAAVAAMHGVQPITSRSDAGRPKFCE